MNKFIRVVFVLFYLLCMVVIYLSTVDKYEVVYDMDPTFPQGSINNNSDNGKIFSGLILLFIFISQIAFFYFEKSKKWKWATGCCSAARFRSLQSCITLFFDLLNASLHIFFKEKQVIISLTYVFVPLALKPRAGYLRYGETYGSASGRY